MTEKHTCRASVSNGPRTVSFHTCGKAAAYEHEGGHYCKTHWPVAAAERRRRAEEAWEAKHAARMAKLDRQVALMRKGALLDECLAALRDCVNAARHVGVLKADRQRVDAAEAVAKKIEKELS